MSLLPKLAKFNFRSLSTKLTRTYSIKNGIEPSSYDDILEKDSEYQEVHDKLLQFDQKRTCFVVQPYIKWGPKKLEGITPAEQLQEATALIETLSTWSVKDTSLIPLESFDKKTLFGQGNLESLRKSIQKDGNIDTVFVNVGTLKKAQAVHLERTFKSTIVDRYRIVMHILKMHATSKHAKLQVALAELHYLQRTSSLQELNALGIDKERFKLMFQKREQGIKAAIDGLRAQRGLLRTKRRKIEYPVVAVVGYTNAGKTSLIRMLTGDERLRPSGRLFATLDVTMHAGLLPSGMKCLFVDTVGFISDIPTNLIECFVATLEDAVLADVIVHVTDLSSSCFDYKAKHVEEVLKGLAGKAGSLDVFSKVITVGNKADLDETRSGSVLHKVSSTTGEGIKELREFLDSEVIRLTNRRRMKIRVPIGGEETRWLYKNSTVVEEVPDEGNSQFVVANVIITEAMLHKFKHFFK